MSPNNPTEISIEEIEAILNTPTGPTVQQSAWVDRLLSERSAFLPTEELAELAAEVQPEGPKATIRGLVEGVMRRHADDDVTVAALSAVLYLHS